MRVWSLCEICNNIGGFGHYVRSVTILVMVLVNVLTMVVGLSLMIILVIFKGHSRDDCTGLMLLVS